MTQLFFQIADENHVGCWADRCVPSERRFDEVTLQWFGLREALSNLPYALNSRFFSSETWPRSVRLVLSIGTVLAPCVQIWDAVG